MERDFVEGGESFCLKPQLSSCFIINSSGHVKLM